MRFFVFLIIASIYGCASYNPQNDPVMVSLKSKYKDPQTTPVSDEVYSEASMGEFIKVICSGKVTPECADKLQDSAVSRFVIEYDYANVAEVKNFCTAYPVECAKRGAIEKLFILSHNQRLEDAIEQRHTSSTEQFKAKNAAAWRDMANSMQEQENKRKENAQRMREIEAAKQQNYNCTTYAGVTNCRGY